MLLYSPNPSTAIIFLTRSWDSGVKLSMWYANGWQTYSENVIVITADADGLSKNTLIQAQTKQGSGPQNLWRLPNASIRKEYSAPERGTILLSSANVKASATDIRSYFNTRTVLFYYFVLQPTKAQLQLIHKLSRSSMFQHYRVIFRQLVFITSQSYISISIAAVGNTI